MDFLRGLPLLRKDTTNYRPVSLLNAFSKVIEKLLYSRIYSYMNDKLCPSQFGFHPGYQTMDLMVFSIKHICRMLQSQGYAMALLFDLAKAFDTLKLDILLKKLESYGIRGLPLGLIKSYLGNRSQKLTVGGVDSEYLPIDIGVPRGSVLGPLLFIIYLNDILKASRENKIAGVNIVN